MKLMRKYRVFVCAVLILCFFSFHISRPRQALAIVPAVSLAAAAVLAVGAAAGLSYTFDNADAESIAGRLQAFLDDVHPGTAISEYFSSRGAAVKDGLMYIGASLYSRICDFLNWEIGTSSLSAGETVSIMDNLDTFVDCDGISYTMSSVAFPNGGNDAYNVSRTIVFLDLGNTFPIHRGTDEIVKIMKYSSLHWLKYFTSSSDTSLHVEATYDGGSTYSAINAGSSFSLPSYDEVYLTFVYCSSLHSPSNGYEGPLHAVYCPDYTYTGRGEYKGFPTSYISVASVHVPFTLAEIQEAALPMTYSPASSLSLTASDVIAFPDVLTGQSVCVDVGLLSDATIDQVADEIIDAAIDGTLSPSISAETWTVDVVATPQELAQDLDTDLTTEVEENPTVPDGETIEFDTPSHYTVRDLRQFFPFCIPFDLFAMLGVLDAEPVAPHFEYRFQPGIANIDHTIVIDFQQFNSVAVLLRRLETLSFCIGLAMVTRNLIRG